MASRMNSGFSFVLLALLVAVDWSLESFFFIRESVGSGAGAGTFSFSGSSSSSSSLSLSSLSSDSESRLRFGARVLMSVCCSSLSSKSEDPEVSS